MTNVQNIAYYVNRNDKTVLVTCFFKTGGSVQERMTMKQFQQFKDQLLRKYLKGAL